MNSDCLNYKLEDPCRPHCCLNFKSRYPFKLPPDHGMFNIPTTPPCGDCKNSEADLFTKMEIRLSNALKDARRLKAANDSLKGEIGILKAPYLEKFPTELQFLRAENERLKALKNEFKASNERLAISERQIRKDVLAELASLFRRTTVVGDECCHEGIRGIKKERVIKWLGSQEASCQ